MASPPSTLGGAGRRHRRVLGNHSSPAPSGKAGPVVISGQQDRDVHQCGNKRKLAEVTTRRHPSDRIPHSGQCKISIFGASFDVAPGFAQPFCTLCPRSCRISPVACYKQKVIVMTDTQASILDADFSYQRYRQCPFVTKRWRSHHRCATDSSILLTETDASHHASQAIRCALRRRWR